MRSKLIKAWGPYPVGTVVVDNKEEAAEIPNSLRVNPARFALLQEKGNLGEVEQERTISSEVRTSEDGAFAPFGAVPESSEDWTEGETAETAEDLDEEADQDTEPDDEEDGA